MTVDELKKAILEKEPEDFVQEHVIEGVSEHVTEEAISKIARLVSAATGIEVSADEVLVVGSSKLGYGLFEKKKAGMPPLPAFREFDAFSDIDVAFVSEKLYDSIWREVNGFALKKTWMPYRMNHLGDYMVYGWIRPDHMPKNARLRIYDSWRDTVRRVSSMGICGRRKISGAIYRDLGFLKSYQSRGIAKCRIGLEEGI